ncbi:ragulator complex protein LAMTOR1 isoform X1 [Rhinolophus sinicus]|uniref:ragulator complex protein LAMTOR1 isoform X1 n=1 Tax=Rhinolophus sinicus TaxID=89399 RepID=UPI00094449ED|nr:PREDICTED: ragulator complex protein LAMTOR1 isoform X1 [Rhinolophus sinicus]
MQQGWACLGWGRLGRRKWPSARRVAELWAGKLGAAVERLVGTEISLEWSSEESGGLALKEREERKLLLDPSSPPTKALNGAEPNYHSLPSARTDEQALLSSILAKTASNIIDVSAADSQGMEQHEYMDRARQYSTRLAVLSSSLTHWKKLPPLPSLTSQPHQVLASEPIPFSDLQQVSRIAAYAYSALSQIRVDAKEELVVQFGIP